ncbi:MAG: TonB-dependent receptor [Elusimicrobiales bacterium]|nr:TonB-dependent receptor [Elusimicrobiales bacterium]
MNVRAPILFGPIAALACLFAACAKPARAQDVWFSISSSAVTGTRIPQPVSQISRDVTILGRDELKSTSVNSAADALNLAPGAEAQSRSPHGVQADVSLRGSTYQQVLVLVDGVRVSDPQTAHHNMDLPVPFDDIERIEVLHGHGSSAYGSDALGGVINIITKKADDNGLRAKAKVSDFNTTLLSASGGRTLGGFSQRLSVEKNKSGGFRQDTDFDTLVLSSKSSLKTGGGETTLALGYMDKAFGAYDFYTPGRNFPSREWTKTCFSELSHHAGLGGMAIAPKLFYRRHDDTFVLDQTRPSFSAGNHTTYSYGGEVQAGLPLGDSDFVFGADASEDEIASSSLGNHARPRQGAFGEYRLWLSQNWGLDAALRADNSDWGVQWSPNIGISYWPSPRWKLRASAGRAFRTPSFTELYYNDPVNAGNAALKPEEAVSYEAGADFMRGRKLTASVTAFLRGQKNLIDWVGQTASGPWAARNIGELTVYGAQSLVKTEIHGFAARLGASLIGSYGQADYISKYALAYPSSQFSLDIRHGLWENAALSVGMLRRSRHNQDGYFLLSAKISWTCKNAEFFADGTNLLDTAYQEVPGIPQPGRWLGLGVSWKL